MDMPDQKNKVIEPEFHIGSFDGPLDLLLHLIDKNKVSIYDIPIAKITDQYIEWINEMQRRDLDVMSEFLLMASTLLDIKSRMLLPRQKNEEGEEIDPRAELVQQLLEYKLFRCISDDLYTLYENTPDMLYKKPTIPDEVLKYEEPVSAGDLLSDITLADLYKVFESVMARQEDRVDPIRSGFGKIEKEEISLDEKMEEMRTYVKTHRFFSFTDLFSGSASKTEVIVTFLSVLELMKTGMIRVSQDGLFSDISIESEVCAGV